MSHADEQQARAPGGRDRDASETTSRRAAARGEGAHGETSAAEWPACPACGAPARRAAARYCPTCGAHLREREYRPADRLRASYRWPNVTTPARPRAHATADPLWRHRNEQTARGYVFLAYALVPVVGIVFCACAAVCCAAGVRAARRGRHSAEAVAARRGVAYAVLLAGVQAFIWLVAFILPWHALS